MIRYDARVERGLKSFECAWSA